MKKIACVGHHCTGAGVIDDLLRECDNVAHGGYEVEFRLLQDADGISDLEYNLVENPHRLYSGFALRRFLIYIKKLKRGYKSLFGPRYYEMAEDYVNNLAKFKYRGSGFLGFTIEPFYGRLYYWIRRALNKICRRMGWKRNLNFLPWAYSYHAICTEDVFLRKTRDFINELCKAMNPDNKEFVVLDQCLSPMNPSRYIRYFDDIKVIIVERDPRDIYIHQKLLNEHVLPISNVYQFCQAYRDNRIILGEVPDNVLYVHFEDMVLHYDEMVKLVFDFLGIDQIHHIAPRTHFNPSVSVRGIGTWRKHAEFTNEIEFIESELSDMLYPVPIDDELLIIQSKYDSSSAERDFKKFS